ncbi:MAG TPA: aspartyl protease family protein [Caulobacteraceae bacterium]|jgi:tetratricopeptide (TPR) repeat protein
MRGHSKFLISGVAAAAIWLAASAAQAECKFGKYFDLPVDMQGNEAVVTTKISGQEARFQVDTGAFFSTLTPEAATKFNLHQAKVPPGYINSLSVEGVGGEDQAWLGEATDINFAGIPIKRLQFVVLRHFHTNTVGLLGENLLSFADVEFDFAHGVMRYFKADGCRDTALAYWADGNYGVIPIDHYDPPASVHIKGTVKINGHPVRAIFDTGAGVSILSRSAAERAGVNMSGPDVKARGVSGGIGRGTIETWTAPIDSFSIADEEIKNTRLTISNKLGMGDVDMLLGMDFFLSHRVLVSRSQSKLYFSYNGGPVFRLDEPPAPKTNAAAAPSDASAAPQTADDFHREGEALMSRRDYAGALQAFDKAVALEPKAPKRYVDRALAHYAMGKHDLARADLDQALAIDPKFASALLHRGNLDLAAKDLPRAAADFDAALKAAPDDDAMHRSIAAYYVLHRHWAEAIPHYDAWIDVHPNDDSLWKVLNERCWARAMTGKDLDKALDDCNAALKKGPRNSQVLDSRGMVNLRLGRFKEAIADYDAAIKLEPKEAWSLYGRGLAKQRSGMKPEGDADIAAALALNPHLDAEARQIGLIDAAPPKVEAKP